MLARLAAALQRGQLQNMGGIHLAGGVGGGGTVVINEEDCCVSMLLCSSTRRSFSIKFLLFPSNAWTILGLDLLTHPRLCECKSATSASLTREP